ncbi:helix-turn-helix domain-containing protein [Alteribacillus sp. YIM 98480]|uniref:helix-turn-helix domain-containing protein n=1 Tax=Alteribacillus sp. YIM 98480 TaxID=2606599 RepID=UPI00131AB852|nr:helix-turn-helix transcriptional regulator [Alteribacillus sp. YIM 98480]
MKPKENVFGERARNLRDKKGKTQEDVANAVGLSRARYSHYENGRVEPDIETIRKLADYYECTTDYLMGLSDIPSNEDTSVREEFNDPRTDLMFKDWKNMTDEQKEEALEMMKYIKFKYGDKNNDK